MTNALELLKSAATTGALAGRNPLDIFYNKIDNQIALANEVKDGKTHNSRSLWFRKVNGSYVVRIGRNAFEIAGSKFFKADDLTAVVDILTAAKEAIRQDKKLQDAVALYSLERSERLKKGRASKKK